MLMIQNNLSDAVAQHPRELITYGGNGAVFQNWAQYRLVMRYLSEKELWAKVDDAWQAQFMPLWGLVRPRDQGFEPEFVVKVYPNAVITWPAREVARRVWAPSLDVQKLNTRVVLDVDQWEAVPTTSASPCRMHVEDAPPTRDRCSNS